MLILFTEKITERLQYICHFILKEQLGLDFAITDQIADTNNENDIIINYSNQIINQRCFHIKPHQLLFENDIKDQSIQCFEINGYIAFFKIENADFLYDVFAASFYLLSRYEEYLPHVKDAYSRYTHENSVAYKNNFLNKPLINIWINDFAEKLQQFQSNIQYYKPAPKTIITYDIDMAWSYKNKGFFRNMGGFLKKPSVERLLVLSGIKKDPFDSFDWINNVHEKKKTEKLSFYLVAESRSLYDKNISPQHSAMRKLIKKEASKNVIGIHPSWSSYNNPTILKKEKKTLEEIIEKKIVHSRQHYIKFDLPHTFHQLIQSEIQNDFSMGYGSINGFRASVASSFFWYDLMNEKTTSLRLYPFCFMDANCYYEQHQNTDEAYNELLYYMNQCMNNNGLFIPIFHNTFLGTDKQFNGWRNLFVKFLDLI